MYTQLICNCVNDHFYSNCYFLYALIVPTCIRIPHNSDTLKQFLVCGVIIIFYRLQTNDGKFAAYAIEQKIQMIGLKRE